MLTLITALMGAVALAALAGARRTDTAVGRFVQYAGPMLGQVSADPATMAKIAALPDVAYSEIGALMLVTPVAVDGRPVSSPTPGTGDHAGDGDPPAAVPGDRPGRPGRRPVAGG